MEPCGIACDECIGVTMAERVAGSIEATRGWSQARQVSEPTTARRARGTPPSGDSADEALFERLRELRKTLADRQRVPAYVVFSDRTLREMAERRPRTLGALLQVSGVGPAKLDRYGDAFLEVLLKD
jgi:ATP-dependent DNA helicase RecQ